MPAAPLTARAVRADATRRAVFRAARDLFAQHGYVDTTVDMIARRAGVAKGTFFVHFATKDAVVTELVRLQTDAALAARQRVLDGGGTLVAALRATVMELGRQAGLSRGVSRAVIAATLEQQSIGDQTSALFDAVTAQMIADARAARIGQPEMLARALVSAYLGAALHFCTARNTPELEALLAPLVEAHLKGLESEEAPHAHDPPSQRPRRRPRPRRRS